MSTLDKLLAFAPTLPGILIIIGIFTLLLVIFTNAAHTVMILIGGGFLALICVMGYGLGWTMRKMP